MDKPHILHLFTPMAQASPFDVNMAYDAGYDAVVPYTNVALDQVAALTQDAIFSRGPKGAKRTGIFIGGRENGLAADMLDAARKAMVPPFEVSVFVDPSGAFTTAAAMVAAVEKHLRKSHGTGLEGKTVMIFGGSGPVGAAAAVLASRAGAKVGIVGREDATRARRTAEDCNRRYGTKVEPVEASTESLKAAMMQKAEVALATAKAGYRVVSAELLAEAPRLLVAADVNAVPPAGVEGVDALDEGKPLEAGSGKAVGIGALAIGNIKYQTQRSLLEAMLQSDKALYLDLQDAFTQARKHAGIA
ncbi:MAG: NAD(P)-dependent methylenetetrahydromethanopterin dehydrogenase [Betaproteobacteria bacterium]